MIKIILKIAIATGIIYWLVTNGRLDFGVIAESLKHPVNWGIAIATVLLIDLLAPIRWRMLLKIKSQKELKYVDMLGLTWLGLFFNSVLPGAVSGDMIKLIYAWNYDKSLSKSFLVTTVFMDRIIGLIGLLTLMGISSLIFYPHLVTISPSMKNLIHFNFFILIAVLVFFGSFFWPQRIKDFILNLFLKIPFIGVKIKKLAAEIWDIGEQKKVVTKCLLLSIALQSMNIFSFWVLVKPFLVVPVSFEQALSFIPIGLTTTALPITPQGIGIGHAAFDTLFSYTKNYNGASIFNLYFLALLMTNLIGVFFYIKAKRH